MFLLAKVEEDKDGDVDSECDGGPSADEDVEGREDSCALPAIVLAESLWVVVVEDSTGDKSSCK